MATGTTVRAMTGFVTDRLQALPVTVEDVPVFQRLWGDERVAQTPGGIRTSRQVQETVVAAVDHWLLHGFGRWVLRAGTTNIGTVKLATWHGRGRSEVELGYAVLPEYWGLGYATEGGAGALQYAATRLGLREVVAFTLPANLRSLAVMERLGFADEQHLTLSGRRHVLRRRRLHA